MMIKEIFAILLLLTFLFFSSCEKNKKENYVSKISNGSNENGNEVNNTLKLESSQDLAVSHMLKAWNNMKILNSMTDQGTIGYLPKNSEVSTTRDALISDIIKNINAAIEAIDTHASKFSDNENNMIRLSNKGDSMDMKPVVGDSLLEEEVKEIKDCPAPMQVFAITFRHVVRFVDLVDSGSKPDPAIGELLRSMLRQQTSYYESLQRFLHRSDGIGK